MNGYNKYREKNKKVDLCVFVLRNIEDEINKNDDNEGREHELMDSGARACCVWRGTLSS